MTAKLGGHLCNNCSVFRDYACNEPMCAVTYDGDLLHFCSNECLVDWSTDIKLGLTPGEIDEETEE